MTSNSSSRTRRHWMVWFKQKTLKTKIKKMYKVLLKSTLKQNLMS